MRICDWCKEINSGLVKVKIANTEFIICKSCAEKFKNKKCIECGSQINLATFSMGRCTECAQEFNSKEERARQDELSEYPFESEGDMDQDLFEAWLTGRPLNRREQ